MGAWGVKALQSDEGLDVLALIEERAAGRASLTADELVDAVREEGLLGDDPSDDEYLYDVTALALAEILTRDVAHREDPLFRDTTFPVTPQGAAVIIAWLTHIRDADEDDREFLELWEGDEEHMAHVVARLNALTSAADPA